jgi:mevalonate kinase
MIFNYAADAFNVVHPDDGIKVSLGALFSEYAAPVSQGMVSVSYLVLRILSALVWDATGAAAVAAGCGLRVVVTSQGLPIGAGLGSSASFSVAVAASCLKLQAQIAAAAGQGGSGAKNALILDACAAAAAASSAGLSGSDTTSVVPPVDVLNVINGWAYASEILLHGCPSGLDNTTSCYGGLVKFSRKDGEKFENISNVPALHILLVNTWVPRSTKQLVAGVRALYTAYPEVVQPMLDSMNSIALKFLTYIDE